MLAGASESPRPRANYPRARRANNKFDGAKASVMGIVILDIRVQTRGVMENMRTELTDLGADLVEITCYLVSINNFGGFNEVYNSYFDATTAPTRTTVAVHQLPYPNILLELKERPLNHVSSYARSDVPNYLSVPVSSHILGFILIFLIGRRRRRLCSFGVGSHSFTDSLSAPLPGC